MTRIQLEKIMTNQNLPIEYILEITEPNDNSCVVESFHSDTPFMFFSIGDYINTGVFNEPQGFLEVTKIEHILWETGEHSQSHKICIRTKKVTNPYG